VLQCVAMCYSVLQCVAVCYSVLQCVAVCVAVCYSVLQCAAVCCSVLLCAHSLISQRPLELDVFKGHTFMFIILRCLESCPVPPPLHLLLLPHARHAR